MRAPSPTYFCTSSLPMTRMKQASVLLATARASSVFPVPAQREASHVTVTSCAGSPCMAFCRAGPSRTPALLRAGRQASNTAPCHDQHQPKKSQAYARSCSQLQASWHGSRLWTCQTECQSGAAPERHLITFGALRLAEGSHLAGRSRARPWAGRCPAAQTSRGAAWAAPPPPASSRSAPCSRRCLQRTLRSHEWLRCSCRCARTTSWRHICDWSAAECLSK